VRSICCSLPYEIQSFSLRDKLKQYNNELALRETTASAPA
jgi:hypothetical protein